MMFVTSLKILARLVVKATSKLNATVIMVFVVIMMELMEIEQIFLLPWASPSAAEDAERAALAAVVEAVVVATRSRLQPTTAGLKKWIMKRMKPVMKMVKFVVMMVMTLMVTELLPPCFPTPVAAVVQTGPVYAQVATSFASNIHKCFLNDTFIGDDNKYDCASKCNQVPECRLFCFKESTCKMYNAAVSPHWTGGSEVFPAGTRCYSSWGTSPSAAAIATVTATDVNYDLYKENAVNGYACWNDLNCFHSIHTMNPWWAADLKAPKRITSVIVVVRCFEASFYGVLFKDVQVRVGNKTSVTGDFDTNTFFDEFSGEPEACASVTFTPTEPVTGSVVSLQSMTEGALVLCDVQIRYQ